MIKNDLPYIVWRNYGYDGWKPVQFKTLEEAVRDKGYGEEFIITKIVEYEVKEKP
jgi:hypothetical protein